LLTLEKDLLELGAQAEVRVGVTIYVPTVVFHFFLILGRVDFTFHSIPFFVFLLLQQL
jgi:hypothetical protein